MECKLEESVEIFHQDLDCNNMKVFPLPKLRDCEIEEVGEVEEVEQFLVSFHFQIHLYHDASLYHNQFGAEWCLHLKLD